MIFQPALLDAVLEGRKTVTRRICVGNPRSPWWRQHCAFAPGQIRAAQRGRGAPREANILIKDVRLELLGALIHASIVDAQIEIMREGFVSYGEFLDAWKRINGPRTWDPRTEVWRVEFELAEVLAGALS